MKFLKFLRKHYILGIVGIVFFVVVFVSSVFAPFITPHNPDYIDLDEFETSATIRHPLGTDEVGRDVLSRIMYGGRISLTVGFLAVIISLVLGILFGAVAGYFGGIVDTVVMRLVDMMLVIPTFFLLLSFQAVFNANIYSTIILIGLTSWMGTARLVRSQVLSIRKRTYVTAATSRGLKHAAILFKHVLPNTYGLLSATAILGMAGAILLESALSFFGLGVQPPLASWGSMLEHAQESMITSWWIAFWPGLMIFLTVLSLNFFGEGVRKYFDPREAYKR
ncbi:ABC transporter permease [Candidatus Margulisiibacteriota bacterium]